MWNKVFLNLQDFGLLYQRGYGIPTVYGPIHFKVNPQLYSRHMMSRLLCATAGSPNFNRESESFTHVSQVDRLFEFPMEAIGKNLNQIKMTEDLKNEFGLKYVSNPEMSLSVKDGLIPLSAVEEILIDSYWFKGDYLYNHVLKLTSINQCQKFNGKIEFRKSSQDYNNEIAEVLLTREANLKQITSEKGVSLGFKN